MQKYNTIAVCGPFGAPVEQFAKALADAITPTPIIVSEMSYLSFNEKQNEFILDKDALEKKLKTSPGRTIFYGHFLLDDPPIRKEFNLKLFIETDSDICVSNYIRQNIKEPLENLLKVYSERLKKANDETIVRTKKHADLVIPYQKNFTTALNLLRSAFTFD